MGGAFGGWATILLAAGCLSATASVETLTHVCVNPDGSGSLTLQVLASERGLAAAGLSASPCDEARLTALAPAFGPDVKYAGGRESRRADGWAGFVARYAFDDVNRVTVSPQVGDLVTSLRGGSAASPMAGYTFLFAAGRPAMLTILQPASEPEPAAAAAGATPPASGMADRTRGEMPRGKRDTVVISVEGTIRETNSAFRSKQRPNMVVLFHLDMDALLAHAEGRAVLSGRRIEGSADAGDGLPGVLAERAGKQVRIVFE